MIKFIKKYTLLFLMIVSFISICLGQEKLKVRVSHTGDDDVGRIVVFKVKDLISSSPRYELGGSDIDCVIEVRIISVEIESSFSAVATNFVLSPELITYYGGQTLGLVLAKDTNNTADRIVSLMDAIFEKHKKKASEISLIYINHIKKELDKIKK